MSIIQGLIGSIGANPPPSYYLYLSGSYNEGGSTTLLVDYRYAKGATVYWSIVTESAVPDVDFTSDNGYSGSLSPTGSGNQTLAHITNINDNTTEGLEWYVINLGTTEGGTDLYSERININDTSIDPLTDFTIEWWQNMNSSQPNSYPRLFDVGYYPTENPGISFEGNPYNGVPIVWGGGSSDRVYNTNFIPGEWVHWAIVRHNNTMALYKNGTNILNSNNLGTATFNNTSSQLTIGTGSGTYWNGKITGFHWIKGTAKYTSNFTPIRAPVTAIANSKLLLNAVDDTNKFTDSSASGFTPTTTTNISFEQDTPWFFGSVTNTLIGAGDTLGVFNNTSMLGWSNIKPGWTIIKVGGGWSSTVVSISGGNVVAADNWINDGSDYTFGPPSTVEAFSSAYSGSAGSFNVLFQSTDTVLANVKNGWTISNGAGWTDIVTQDAYIGSGYYRVPVAGSVNPTNGYTYTFTPPTQTGSLTFSGATLAYAANAAWAFDV